jgi:hypothetical protein
MAILPMLGVALPWVLLFVVFTVWYGGNGKPMHKDELEGMLRELEASDSSDHTGTAMDEVRELMASDDGKEFVMQNLVRYRPRALYPPGYNFSDDPREADKRYGKAILGDLLRNGNLLFFVARRSGKFLTPPGADAWHYVAMVRYRSRRDFLRFAIASNQADKFVHKWAAIEKTHVFPVKPILNLFLVRSMVGGFLALLWVASYWLVI